MKTKEELNAIKEEVETLNRKLEELNEEEFEQVVGGVALDDEEGKRGYIVGIFPGVSGFP